MSGDALDDEASSVDLVRLREGRYKRLVKEWEEVGQAFFSGPLYGNPEVLLDKALAEGRNANAGRVLDALNLLHKRQYASGAVALRSDDRAAGATWFRRSLATGVCYVSVQSSLFSDIGRTYADWGELRGGDLCARMMMMSLAGSLGQLSRWSAACVKSILSAGGSVSSSAVHKQEDDGFFDWMSNAVVSQSLSGPRSRIDDEVEALLHSVNERAIGLDAMDRYCDIRVSRALHYDSPADRRPAGHSEGALYWMELFPDSLFPIELFALVGLRSSLNRGELELQGGHPLLREFGSRFPDLGPSGQGVQESGFAEIDFDSRIKRVVELAPSWFRSEFCIGGLHAR